MITHKLFYFFTFFSVPFTIFGAYNEAPCLNRGGTCMQQSQCRASTVKGLCPTQPKDVRCCINNGVGASGKCGCEYDYATRPTSGPAPGARRLATYFSNKFGGRTEIYNNRNVRGGKTLSLHAEGRAVDLYAGANGRAAFDHAVAIACNRGIQEVIYNRRIWTNGRGERAYNGVNPHTDHVHIGLNRCGAQNF